MKKFLATFLMMALMAVILPFATATEVSAQTRYGRVTTYQKRSFYQKHRDKINVGIGAGAGALLGSLFGGKKGALLGALAGGGGGALYTYKIKPKNRTYYRGY